MSHSVCPLLSPELAHGIIRQRAVDEKSMVRGEGKAQRHVSPNVQSTTPSDCYMLGPGKRGIIA